ncbi:hypothetical protein GCM10009020_16000 [Natronoarchaeum mannanilyticum]|uniref:Uncharacterized protein n=2 Tax=Natronoarchaeum mannanilyticum TaxID=926360 RepID=A0AAV3TAY7_9EURY
MDRGGQMTLWVDVVRVAVLANVALLLVLGYVWGRNYLQFRSKHTLGLLLFAAFLLTQNLLNLYFYLVHPDLSPWWHSAAVPPIVWRAQMLLHVSQTVGLAFLTWVTWD